MSHDNWRTPKNLFDVLDREFTFDMDAAADDRNHLCPRYIHAADDALTMGWGPGSVFLNPPYSQLGPFIRKAWEESHEGSTVVCLLPAYTDTRYWQQFVTQAHEIRHLHGRVSFLDEDGTKKTTARFPSVVVVFRELSGHCYGKSPNQFVWDWIHRAR